MKGFLFIILSSVVIIFSPLFITAQKQRIEFAANLTIDETIAELKLNDLLPRTNLEIAVVGEVMLPGIILIKSELSFVEALAYQGGVSNKATGIIRILIPDNSGGYREQPVDLKAVNKGIQRVTLKGGEIVLVLSGRKNLRIPPDLILPTNSPRNNA